MRKDDPQINLRVPLELKEKILEAAKENQRTQTAEMIARLEESFILEDRMGGPALQTLTEIESALSDMSRSIDRMSKEIKSR